MIMRSKKCTTSKKDVVKQSAEPKVLKLSKLPKSSAKVSTSDSNSSYDETFIPDDISDISYKSSSDSIQPNPCCKRYKKLQITSNDPEIQIDALCPKGYCDNARIMFYHLTGTFLLYMIIYPVVNFIWTYCSNTEQEVLTLFDFVTGSASNKNGYMQHFIAMKWLRLPPTTAESVALLIASALKDTIAFQWDGISKDKTLIDIICSIVARRHSD